MSSSVFPSYRARYLPAMTAREIAALPDRAWAPAIVATGAIEQHGPHLPVAVDSFLGQVWLDSIFARMTPEVSAYALPPITIGKSNEHVGFPGTLYISKETLRFQLLALARQAKTWGFRQFITLNTHGGNSAVIRYTLREIQATLGLRTGWLSAPATIDVSKLESTYGFHANQFETAALLHLAGGITRQERAVCCYPGSLEDPGELRPEFAPATFSWATQDISPSGIMGDAPAATAEQGERWTRAVAEAFYGDLAQWCASGRRAAGIA
jgi:creatinine amidohydrolase